MTTIFTINPKNLDKWMHQNNAQPTGDYFYGVLLDNFMVSTKRGYAAIYEHYVNPNMSDYLVKFQAGDGAEIYDEFIQIGCERMGIA